MNTLVLDKTEPAIASLISAWKDGESYTLSNVQMEQTSSDETKAVFHVTSIESPDAAETEAGEETPETSPEETPEEAPATAAPPMPMMGAAKKPKAPMAMMEE